MDQFGKDWIGPWNVAENAEVAWAWVWAYGGRLRLRLALVFVFVLSL